MESKEEPKAEEIIVYWFAPNGYLILLLYTTEDHLPREDAAYGNLGIPPLITNQRNDSEVCHRVIWCRYFWIEDSSS